jgi:RNA polymerase sigma-70 factor (ECF subfamily)
LLHPKEYSKLNDEELLQRYRRSNSNEWLGYLLQRYTMLLLGVGMKYLKDKDAAEDAVQQVFLKALTHLPQGTIQNFKGWLYVLMRNHCLQQLRDKTYNTSSDILQQLPATDTTEDLKQKDYTIEQMDSALKELSSEQQQCIDMFYLQKLSYNQICNKTGYTFMQVKSYIQNGKRNLKQNMLKKMANDNS